MSPPSAGVAPVAGRPQLGARSPQALDESALALPPAFELRQASARLGERLLATDLAIAHGDAHRFFAGDDRELELQRLDGPPRVLDRGRHGVLADGHARAGRVEQAHGLVGELAVGDVPVRERDRRDDRLVEQVDAVMGAHRPGDVAHHDDGLLLGGLLDGDDLEAPRERRVLLDVLLVLGPGGRGDGAERAARQGGLEQVRRVARARGAARADQRVRLVDEEDDRLGRRLHLLDDLPQAVLELALHPGAGLEQPQIERPERHVLEGRRHVAARDPVGEPLDDGRLADARFAREDRVVLPPAHQDVDHLADLVLAPHDRIELLLAGPLGQVDGELRERLLLAHRGGRDRLGALRSLRGGGGLLLRRSGDDRRELVGELVGVDLQKLARDGREHVAQVRRLDHAEDRVTHAHPRLAELEARVQPALLHRLLDVDRQVTDGGRPARQAIEGLEQVAGDAPRIELEVPRDPVQVRVGLLEDLMEPVRQLHVRVASHLAEDCGAFEGAVAELVELSEERSAADVGHGRRDPLSGF